MPPASAPRRRTACIITVGDELLRGDVTDTNGTEASRRLTTRGVSVQTRHTVADHTGAIAHAVNQALINNDFVVVIGGLGPTSDDVTRFAVAHALRRTIHESEPAWRAILARLDSFGIPPHPDNRRQAQFPEGSILLPNEHGTAWGARIPFAGRHVLLLPGPPHECLPMLATALADLGLPTEQPEPLRWRVLGLHEPEVAARVDTVLAAHAGLPSAGYRWAYPYVDVILHATPEQHTALVTEISAALHGHIVSTTGRSALDQIRDLLPGYELHLTDSLSQNHFANQLGESVHPAHTAAPTAVTVHATGAWQDGSPTDHRGSVAMSCTVTAGSVTQTYRLEQPNLSPEIHRCAAEFIAWSILRALPAPGV